MTPYRAADSFDGRYVGMREQAPPSEERAMKAVTWHGKRDVRVEEVPDPRIQEPTDAIIKVTTHRHLRLRPAPVRGARAVHRPRATSSATSRWASSRRSAPRSPHIKPGDRVVIPFNISCGHCWMCGDGALRPVRDHPGPRARHGRRAVRLHQAVRPGARRPGRVPARAAGPVRPDQGARRPARRAVPLPVRRAAHRPGRPSSTPTSPRAAASRSSGSAPIGQMCAADRPPPRRTG